MIRALFSILLLFASGVHADEVRILHFSDYHSHALPFYASGGTVGGIARAIGYIRSARGPRTLVFNGGDTMNHGSPSWSDDYRCVEWIWWNGLVDAMALGNHDADYGPGEFSRCAKRIRYPIVSANTLDATGTPLFHPYVVFRRGGHTIGVFAVAGPDFEKLVPADRRPEHARFGDPVAAAREAVATLRGREHVDAVVLIGHEQTEDDEALARSVPGIDLILGTHAHRVQPLHVIDGTNTWMLSPGQYLEYISDVRLEFERKTLRSIGGGIVRMTAVLPEESRTARRVARLERQLERDSRFRDQFSVIGSAATPLTTDGALETESILGDFVTDAMREAAGADVAVCTTSSLRQSIAPGTIRREDLTTALPYDNAIFVIEVDGRKFRQLLDYSIIRRGSDFFSQLSGVRFRIAGGKAVDLEVRRNGAPDFEPLRDDAVYHLAVTDFQALVATGYRDIFAGLPRRETALRLRSVVEDAIRRLTPVKAALDGRMR
jgi:5'-nucleotidase / UDP-sugar diphosphatase